MENSTNNIMTIEKENKLFQAIIFILEKGDGKNKFIVDKNLYNEIKNHKIFKRANLDEINTKELVARLSLFAIYEKNSKLFNCIFGNDNKQNYEIVNEIYKINYLTPKVLEYILKKKNNCLYISSQLIRNFIQKNQFDLSDILFKYSRFYDNEIILKFCHYYKYKKSMSSEELQNIISDDKYIIESNKYEINDDEEKFTTYELYYYSYLRGNYLSHACKNGHEFIIKYLIEHGADVNKNANVKARYIYDNNGRGGDDDDNEDDEDDNDDNEDDEDDNDDNDDEEEDDEDDEDEYEYYYKMKEFGNDGYWDIYEACAYGYYDAYTTSVDYDIPLIAACSNGNEAIVKYLVQHGADVNQNSKFSTPLVAACKNDNKDLVKYLIEQGANVNQKGWQDLVDLSMKTNAVWDGNTSLIEACKNENEYIVKYLVEHGANINVVNNYGVSPLSFVCKNKNEALVKYLVEHGADVNQKGWQDSEDFGMRYYTIVYENGKRYKVDCDDNMTPLLVACENGNETIVKYLVEHGADVNQKYKYYHKSNYNYIYHYYITPLVIACKSRNEVIVKYLVECGANVDPDDTDVNVYYFTPLVTSCKYGNEAIVKYLVEHGSDVYRKSPIYEENNSGINDLFYTPLEAAKKNKNEGIEKYLKNIMEHSTYINQTIKYNESLVTACKDGNETIVKYSVEHGANVNYIGRNPKEGKEPKNDEDFYNDDDDYDIPLLAACCHGNEAIVKYLVEHGANVNLNGKYNTPLTAACKNGNESLVIYLIEHGANIDYEDNINSLTPLVAACISGKESIVKYLVEHGADINRKGRRKHKYIDYLSPLVTACEYENEAIVKYLTEQGANVNIIDEYSTSFGKFCNTPLRAVCKNGNKALVKYLVEKGSLIDFPQKLICHNSEYRNPTQDYFTPLIMACRYGNESIVKYLVEHGADVNLKGEHYHRIRNDYYYETPLVAACKNGNESIVKYLVEHDADVKKYIGTYPYRYIKPKVDDNNQNFYIPLMAACKNGNEAIVKNLVDHGADVKKLCEYIESSSDEASINESETLIKNLVGHSINIDLLDDPDYNNYFGECLTPLIIACKFGNEAMVKLLVEYGADVNQVGLRKYRKNTNFYEETPLVTACFYGNEAIVRYLVDHGADINQKYRIEIKKLSKNKI